MKLLRKTFATALLSLLLSVPASAGDMPGGIITLPPPPNHQQSLATIEVSVTSPGCAAIALDPVTEIAVNMLQSVLSLF